MHGTYEEIRQFDHVVFHIYEGAILFSPPYSGPFPVAVFAANMTSQSLTPNLPSPLARAVPCSIFHLDRRRRRRVQFSTPLTSSPPEQLQMSPFPSFPFPPSHFRESSLARPSAMSVRVPTSSLRERVIRSWIDFFPATMVSQWEESITGGRRRCIQTEMFSFTR